jgi:hypothetical protein
MWNEVQVQYPVHWFLVIIAEDTCLQSVSWDSRTAQKAKVGPATAVNPKHQFYGVRRCIRRDQDPWVGITVCPSNSVEPVLPALWIRIRSIRMFLGHPDPSLIVRIRILVTEVKSWIRIDVFLQPRTGFSLERSTFNLFRSSGFVLFVEWLIILGKEL